MIAVKSFMSENKQHSLIDPRQSYEQYHNWAYNTALQGFKNETKESKSFHFHGERNAYTHERYHELWKEKTGVAVQTPVVAGFSGSDWTEYAAEQTRLSIQQIKSIDKEIRLEVSHELGHDRIAIARDYLG